MWSVKGDGRVEVEMVAKRVEGRGSAGTDKGHDSRGNCH